MMPPNTAGANSAEHIVNEIAIIENLGVRVATA
jgi:hypothetical protein